MSKKEIPIFNYSDGAGGTLISSKDLPANTGTVWIASLEGGTTGGYLDKGAKRPDR